MNWNTFKTEVEKQMKRLDISPEDDITRIDIVWPVEGLIQVEKEPGKLTRTFCVESKV